MMKKSIIKKDKEKISEQEIQQNMNFDKFISGYTPPVKGWLSAGTKLYTLIASVVTIAAVAGYFIVNATKNDDLVAAPFVNPPVKALAIPSNSFLINTEKDSTLVHTSGSVIAIPAEAFVDGEGKDVKGKVEIHYREFHDAIDILLSGIPMHYDSAGITYQLESAGMFEITASKDGKPVTLKPNKSLTVNMISHTNNSTDYNIYNLDTVKQKWEYVSENTAKNNTCVSAFEDRVGDVAKTKDEIKAFVSTEKPIRPRKSSAERNNFSIDFSKDEFPELAVFTGLKFEPTDKKYNAELSKKVWEEVLIERCDDNEHYKVTFSSKKESHSFTVLPVVDEKDYETTMKDFAIKQKKYEMRLAEKKRESAKATDSLYKVNAKFNKIAERSDLNERFNSFVNDSYNESSKDLLAYRTFEVTKLGIWNSDVPFFTSGRARYRATFIDNDNQPLALKSVYMIAREKNTARLIPKNEFGVFPYGVGIVDVMVGITEENQLVYLKDQELKEVKNKGNTILFKMNKTDEGVVSSTQLKNLLKI